MNLNYQQFKQLKLAYQFSSRDEIRQNMTGVCIWNNRMVATDAHCMYDQKTDIEGAWWVTDAVIKKLKCKQHETVEVVEALPLTVGDNGRPHRYVSTEQGEDKKISYPDYDAIYPKFVETVTIASNNRDHLIAICNAATPTSKHGAVEIFITTKFVNNGDNKGILYITITPNIELGKGSINCEVPCLNIEVAPFRFGISASLLLKILKNTTGSISIQRTDNAHSALVINGILIMPVLLDKI